MRRLAHAPAIPPMTIATPPSAANVTPIPTPADPARYGQVSPTNQAAECRGQRAGREPGRDPRPDDAHGEDRQQAGQHDQVGRAGQTPAAEVPAATGRTDDRARPRQEEPEDRDRGADGHEPARHIERSIDRRDRIRPGGRIGTIRSAGARTGAVHGSGRHLAHPRRGRGARAGKRGDRRDGRHRRAARAGAPRRVAAAQAAPAPDRSRRPARAEGAASVGRGVSRGSAAAGMGSAVASRAVSFAAIGGQRPGAVRAGVRLAPATAASSAPQAGHDRRPYGTASPHPTQSMTWNFMLSSPTRSPSRVDPAYSLCRRRCASPIPRSAVGRCPERPGPGRDRRRSRRRLARHTRRRSAAARRPTARRTGAS